MPGVVKVKLKLDGGVKPPGISPESHTRGLLVLVVVWLSTPSLVHVTVVPTETVSRLGTNL